MTPESVSNRTLTGPAAQLPVTPSIQSSRIPTLHPLTPTTPNSTLFYPECTNVQFTPPNSNTLTVYNTILSENSTLLNPPKPLHPLSTVGTPVRNSYIQSPYQGGLTFYSPYNVRAGVPSRLLLPAYQWTSDMFPTLNSSNASKLDQNSTLMNQHNYSIRAGNSFSSLDLQNYSRISSLPPSSTSLLDLSAMGVQWNHSAMGVQGDHSATEVQGGHSPHCNRDFDDL